MSGGKAARWRDEDTADDFVRQSVGWIEAHRQEPFFLFFASPDCHVPRMPHERFQGKSTLGYRGDTIVQLDWCVGELIKTLKRLDLDQKTLVLFVSDNGPVLDDGYKDGAEEKLGSHRPAGPYRGGKYSVYEGGTRTPFITWWPGKIRPGVSDEMVCTIDLAASVAAMTGQSLPPEACPDSFDVWDALVGKEGASGRKQLIQQGNFMKRLGFVDGHWKLVRVQDVKATNARRKRDQADKLALYNLLEDPGEQHNLAEALPDRAKALGDRLTALIQAGRSR
jgi:arylsulfatase A-like enzyme